MNDYYLRCIPADYDRMIAIGVALGAVTVEEGVVTPTQGGVWDYIGEIAEQTGVDDEGNPITAPVSDANGVPYIHINLRTPIALGETAQQMAQEHPEVAEGLAELGRFFLLDAEGNARAPSAPLRVFL